MKLVIVIPDKDRRDIYWSNGKRVANLIGEYKVLAVLPEGHGDLISRSELKKALQEYKQTQYNDDRPDLEYEYIDIDDLNYAIDNAPTVIEADKENGND